MADTDILQCENDLVDAFLDYIDWRASGSEPEPVTIATRKEGHPRHFLATANFPLVCVRIIARLSSGLEGQQQPIQFTVRVMVVVQVASGEEPDTILRQTTGKIIENILQTKRLLSPASYVGLDWIQDVTFPATLYENDFEQWLRAAAAQNPEFGAFTASQSDFAVTTTYAYQGS